MHTTLQLDGLTCDACVKLCTMKLTKLAGVTAVSIDLATGRLDIASDAPVSTDAVNAALAGTHYRARPFAEQ